MSLLTDALPGLLSATGATALAALGAAAWRRLQSRRMQGAQGAGTTAALAASRTFRRYTLLRTAVGGGTPDQYETTRPPGTVITYRVNGHPQRFELTDAPLGDGTYAAEPLDHG
ncbi:hypothetical protein [Streptomyces sp. NPDC089799]|uniref:hypothetical protein n=1 Tax=Streptomyces sp. NPDC089799 TaxID=3155066 RepID=UPI0034462BFF